jgi:4-hydroxy-tetrahydrodipicolinate reductase
MPEPVRLAVCGAAGRMGAAIARLAATDPAFHLVGGIDRDTSGGGDFPTIRRMEDAADLLRDADVVIDFSAPEFLSRLLADHADDLRGRALVVGTTGLGAEEERLLSGAAQHSPVLTAANFSVAVNLLLALAADAARVLGADYDVEIVEAHHRRKEDAPSGTALALGEAVAGARDLDLAAARRDGRSGRPGPRAADEIGFHALRGGRLAGEHEVRFLGDMDQLALVHRATDRALFARGALRAATWIAPRPPGRYAMRDVLGLAQG